MARPGATHLKMLVLSLFRNQGCETNSIKFGLGQGIMDKNKFEVTSV